MPDLGVGDVPALLLRPYGLIADDLTGACDAGAQFAQLGFSSLVCIDPARSSLGSPDLTILTTDSRNDPPEKARSKSAAASRLLIREGREIIYKKLDSTLLGNLAFEIQAIMESCRFSLGIVAPAFPAMGRTLDAGWLQISGATPVKPIHLPTLLREQGLNQVEHINRTSLAAGADVLISRLKKAGSGAKSVIVLDAVSDQDLTMIAYAGIELLGCALMVGSSGLASSAASILAQKHQNALRLATTSFDQREQPGSVLLIIGSTNPATRTQMDYLVKNSSVVSVMPGSTTIRKALDAFKNQQHLLMTISRAEDDEVRLEEFLPLLENSGLCGIALCGGDTAGAVLRTFRATGIKLERELLPGIPCGRVVGGPADGLAVVTKAGGFGGATTLVKVTDFLALQTRQRS